VTDAPKNLGNPGETISFPGITEDLVEIAGMTVARTVQAPVSSRSSLFVSVNGTSQSYGAAQG